MKIREFHLYRAKFIQSDQIGVFESPMSPREIFDRAIQERPNIERPEQSAWHIGNVAFIDDHSGSLVVGRTTKTTAERYDETTGNFIEQVDDAGPHTFVFFDLEIGLVAIAKKSKVAADVPAIARRIQILLQQTKVVLDNNVSVRIDMIPDPQNFIEKLRTAHTIMRFIAYFTGPNPDDADEYFQKPISVYAKKINAISGNVDVRGRHLNEQVAESVARSTAATGNHAAAVIRTSADSAPLRVSMQKEAARVTVDKESHNAEVLEQIRARYREVRSQ